MGIITDDTMADTTGVLLMAHTVTDVGGPWKRHINTAANASYRCTSNRFYPNTLGTGLQPIIFYPDDAPATAEYDVEVDCYHHDDYGNAGIVGRLSASAKTFYFGYHGNGSGATPQWVLIKSVAGLLTTLDFLNEAYPVTEGRLKLEIRNATKSLYFDDGGGYDLKCSSTDNQITTAGFGGLRSAFQYGDNEGKQFSNLVITDLASAVTTPQVLMIGD